VVIERRFLGDLVSTLSIFVQSACVALGGTKQACVEAFGASLDRLNADVTTDLAKARAVSSAACEKKGASVVAAIVGLAESAYHPG